MFSALSVRIDYTNELSLDAFLILPLKQLFSTSFLQSYKKCWSKRSRSSYTDLQLLKPVEFLRLYL